MAIVHKRSKRKKTGGLYNKQRKRKKEDFGSDFIPVKIAETKLKQVRTLGANVKNRILRTNKANVVDPSTGKSQVVEIKGVLENKANPNFVRMNIITKGATIDTELGQAKIVSRPGQHGTVNAVLVKK